MIAKTILSKKVIFFIYFANLNISVFASDTRSIDNKIPIADDERLN